MKREPEGSLGHAVKALHPAEVKELLSPFQFKTNPFDHQNRSLVLGVDQESWLFALDMGTGKALMNGEPVLTTQGWKPIEDLQVGDQVYSNDGKAYPLLGVHPQGVKEVYTIHFKNGTKVNCCKDHLWNVRTPGDKRSGRDFKTKSTIEIIERGLKTSINKNGGYRNHLPKVNAVQYSTKQLPIHPYVLGYLLGDGGISQHVGISIGEFDQWFSVPKLSALIDNHELKRTSKHGVILVGKNGNRINTMRTRLRKLGVAVTSDKKFIPREYLDADYTQRLEMVQGLMDTDGFISKRGTTLQYASCSKRLATDFKELAESLGAVCSITFRPNDTKGSYTININMDVCPFSLPRKVERFNRRLNKYVAEHRIVDITYFGQAECTCITTTAPSELFLTRDFIPTHNSKLSLDLITIHRNLEGCQKALISAPPIVLRHWKKQVALHSDMSVTIVEGNAEEKRWLFENAQTDIVVVSQPWLVTLFGRTMKEPGKKAKEPALEAWLIKVFSQFDILIIDEVHTCKNASSVGFKGFKKFCLDIPIRYFMTGTPIGNNYVGIFSLYYLMDKGKTFGQTFSGFTKEWFTTFMVNGRYARYTLRSEKREEFMKKFWSKMIRWEEKECNTLPEKSYIRMPVSMTREQEVLYDELIDNCEENKAIDSDLMRVTAGVGMEDSPKLEALLAIIEEVCVLNNNPLIVWHWLDDEGILIEQAIKKHFKKLAFVSMRGSVNKKIIEKGIEDWHAKKIDLIVGNVKSIGIGVDLYEANKMVFFSNNRSIIDRMQAEKRIHRTGQTKHCTYYDLMIEGTVDQINLEILDRARASFVSITKDGSVDTTKQAGEPVITKEQLKRVAYKE